MKTIILDELKIERILRRIAYQILEECHREDEIILAGILPRGVWVAEQLQMHLSQIASKLSTRMVNIDLDQMDEAGWQAIQANGKTVILIDDIVNSGETMMLAAGELSSQKPQKLLTACLVNRSHRRYPITSNFTGLSLATTLQEHLSLVIKPSPTVFLQ